MWTRPAPACSCSTTSPGTTRLRRSSCREYLAGWYEAETGLDNCTLLTPLEGEQSGYVLINHARWDGSLPLFMARQLPKKSFRSYMLANLKAHHLAAMPVLYRLA
jgi:hypothetical protein